MVPPDIMAWIPARSRCFAADRADVRLRAHETRMIRRGAAKARIRSLFAMMTAYVFLLRGGFGVGLPYYIDTPGVSVMQRVGPGLSTLVV